MISTDEGRRTKDEESALPPSASANAARTVRAEKSAGSGARKGRLLALRVGTHIAALLPLAVLVWDYLGDQLTANPIQEATFRTGKTALVLLALSLLCTPLVRLLGWKPAQALRRPLGLYAFFYAALHLAIFAAVDYGLDWGLIQQAVAETRYVLVGLAAFVLLAPLALTSTKGWQRRLGRRWLALHRLVYLAAPLAVLHFALLVKSDIREPLAYGAAVATLLILRLPPVRRVAAWLGSKQVRGEV